MTLTQTKSETAATKKLQGKVALVTGGSRGIGRGIAERLASEGAHVVITYAKSKKGAEEAVANIQKDGGKALAIKSDVASDTDLQSLIEQIKNAVGRVDVLVNNAAVWEGGTIEETTLDQYDRVFNVNVRGVLATTLATLKLIPDGGRIINISSGAAEVTLPGLGVYSATKAALNSLTRTWAQELGPRQITVNAVSPGPTATDMMHEALPDPAVQKGFAEKTALRRIGTPDDIAAVVAFLASEDGGWITGQAIRADGGINI